MLRLQKLKNSGEYHCLDENCELANFVVVFSLQLTSKKDVCRLRSINLAESVRST